jgi:hypothetical protein
VIWPTLSILIALAVAAIITTPDKPPERTHIYWCYVAARVEVNGEWFVWTGSLPCKWRTNTPVSV